MAYNEFTLSQVREKFGLIIEELENLFAKVSGIKPSQILQTFLNENLTLATAINT